MCWSVDSLPTSSLPPPSSVLPSSPNYPSPPLPPHFPPLPLFPYHVQVIVVWGGKESIPQRLKLPPLPVPLLSVPQPFPEVGVDFIIVIA